MWRSPERPRSGRIRLALALAVAATLATLPATASAADDGAATFGQLCSGCHTIGGGNGAGPDLAGLAGRRPRDWVARMIADPAGLVASGDADATALVGQYGMTMPTLGVSAAQVDALLSYLGFAAPTPTTPTPTTPTPAPAPAPAATGDAERGKDLFTGDAGLSAGGPSCLSCHDVAGVGGMGGGMLGPDLTGAFRKYGGAQGLTSSLATIPFPTMAPIFSRKPLSAREQADLVAFLESAPGRARASLATQTFVGVGLGITVAMIIAGAVIWRRRLPAVRRSLVNRTKER